MSHDPSSRRTGRTIPADRSRRPLSAAEFTRWWLASLLAIALAWCSTQAQAQTTTVPGGAEAGWGATPAAAALAAGGAGASMHDYRIARGDELNLRFYFTPELNTSATVRSDGRISLPLLGELQVEGLTVAELAALVERLLAPQVKRAQVAINVQGSPTQRVFVGGEVGKPGMQPLIGPLTALQAVMVAEGLKDTALPSEVLVLRRTAQGGREVLKADLEAVMSGRQPQADVALQPFDVIVVPRSGIADVGRWVDLYIRRVLPVSFGFNYAVESRRGSAP